MFLVLGEEFDVVSGGKVQPGPNVSYSKRI